MNFGYFCNTTNWNKKPYTQLLEEAREIAIYCDQNNWNSIWFTEHHFNHEGMESCTNPFDDVYRCCRKNKSNKIRSSM